MKRMLMAGTVALVAGTQAFAADLPPPMAPPPPRAPAAYVPIPSPVYNWSGFYIGLNAGYAFGDSTWSANGVSSGSFATDGPQFGGTVGFNYQFGQIVLGLEGDYDWQNIRGSSNTPPCVFPGIGGCNTASNWIGTFRGRVGYAFDRVMLYGTAGGAVTDIQASSGLLPWASSTELGWTVGAGVEAAITDNLTAKVEYLFADFENGSCAVTSCGTPVAANVSLYENMVRVGLNYKFGY
jgi:outer membrane immunogenic protein